MRARRARRTSAKIRGTAERPRLAVFRSNRFTYVQLVDDGARKTLAYASSVEASAGIKGEKGKIAAARLAGEMLAKRARDVGITRAVFDRRAYRYHGLVKAVADGARAGGLVI